MAYEWFRGHDFVGHDGARRRVSLDMTGPVTKLRRRVTPRRLSVSGRRSRNEPTPETAGRRSKAAPCVGFDRRPSGHRVGITLSHVVLGATDRESMAGMLERAEQRVIDRLIAQHKELIDRLLAVGLDASTSRNMPVRLEQTQSLRVEWASKLRRDLLNASPTESSRKRPTSSPPPDG